MPDSPEHTPNTRPTRRAIASDAVASDAVAAGGVRVVDVATILAALLPIAGTSALFLAQVDMQALLREWLRPEASGGALSMIAIAALAGGPLLAACLSE